MSRFASSYLVSDLPLHVVQNGDCLDDKDDSIHEDFSEDTSLSNLRLISLCRWMFRLVLFVALDGGHGWSKSQYPRNETTHVAIVGDAESDTLRLGRHQCWVAMGIGTRD